MKNTLETLENRRLMTTFMVTNALDSGLGSLREAIAQANAASTPDVIQFAIGSGQATIGLLSTLSITQPVTIDATTQPGYAGTPLIRLNDGASVSTALEVKAAGSVVRGFSITNMDGPGLIVVKQNITIEKCYIGLRQDGTVGANTADGIGIGINGDNAIIRNNVISGNGGDGVQVFGDNVTIAGNIIGLDATGSFSRPNAGHGVLNLGVIGLTVGGDTAADGNVISSNGMAGVRFDNLNAKGSIYSNLIGTNKTGNAILANGTYGIDLHATSNVTVGASGKSNRIGGNGIRLDGNGNSNTIQNNNIGFGSNPIFDIGSATGINIAAGNTNTIEANTIGKCANGLLITGNNNVAKNNYVGITANGVAIGNDNGVTVSGESNKIESNSVANNLNAGIYIASGNNNSMMSSRVWNNDHTFLFALGVNDGIQAPAIMNNLVQDASTGQWSAAATFNGLTAGTKYTVSFYRSASAGQAASGQIQEFIQGTTFTAAGVDGEFKAINFPADKGRDGWYLTAIVSESTVVNGILVYGSTSKPSAALQFVGLPSVYASNFEFETAHAWTFTFSDDISASLSASDLAITTSTGTTYSANAVTWNAATKTARFTRTTPLPDAYYTAKIKTQSVSNSFGANIENFPLGFRVYRGDANSDGLVNFDDLLIVAQNYGKTGMTFSQGNFNYDAQGKVDFDDLLILAQKYTIGSSIGARGASTRSTVSQDVLN